MGGHPAHWTGPSLGIELDTHLCFISTFAFEESESRGVTVTYVTQQGK